MIILVWFIVNKVCVAFALYKYRNSWYGIFFHDLMVTFYKNTKVLVFTQFHLLSSFG